MSIECPKAGRCGGCAWIGRPWHEQREQKVATLLQLLYRAGIEVSSAAIELLDVGQSGLRDRTDLAFRRGPDGPIWGLHGLGDEGIVDVGACPALSPALAAFLADLRLDPLPLDRASLRLRVAPSGARGLWVDAANEDVKHLMDDGAWLRRRLADGVFVEIGQRQKPVWDDLAEGTPRLRLARQPEHRAWFETLDVEKQLPLPLFTPVSGFTQPGIAANRVLVGAVLAAVARAGGDRWLELGAGAGNFTLPLAAQGRTLLVVETDEVAMEGLRRGAEEAGLLDRITPSSATLDRNDLALARAVAGADCVLADPPRSGLRAALEALSATSTGPSRLVYVSCWTESLASDCGALVRAGWAVDRIVGVDQFAQSAQAEWVAELSRSR